MKSQTSIKILLPLLLVLMTGAGDLSGQAVLGIGLCLHSDPFASCNDQQRLKRPGEAKTRSEQVQQQRGRRTDSQRRRDRLSTVKMWKLTEYLDLSEEQAGKFFPRTQEHQKEMDRIVQQRRQLYEDFQRKIDDGEIKTGDEERYINETARLDRTLIDLRIQHLQGMKDILSEEQMARLAVFNEHFRRQISQGLREELPPEGAPPNRDEEE